MEKVWIFLQKPRTKPFGKLQNLGLCEIDFFTTQSRLLFVLKYHTTLFIALFVIKTKDEESLNFLTKTIV